MFENFGEFDSAEEINKAAAAQKEQGDIQAVRDIAEENGIDKEDAEDYIDGIVDDLTTPSMAALGKLKVEKADLKTTGILEEWVEELESRAVSDMNFAKAVRKKGKSLAGYIAKMAEYGYNHRAIVSKDICELLTGDIKRIVGNHEFSIGVPTKAERTKIASEYYGVQS